LGYLAKEVAVLVPQKVQYALRGLFELAKRSGEGPVKVGDIAEKQAIPPRFLEVILSQLKRAGFVESRRGREGGYMLSRSPESLTVGEVVRFIDGPISPVGCIEAASKDRCQLYGGCVFLPMWQQVQQAIASVYDNTTFQNLVDQEKASRDNYVPAYAI
jgi:Rrf2 family protein